MSYQNLPIGDKAPEVVTAVIEIPKGSHNKYEYSEEHHVIMLDRVLHSPMFYPTDYGFIPETRSEDGDHLDVMVLITDPVFPGCVMSVRPIGAVDMVDGGEQDWKIVAVAEKDPSLKHIQDVQDLSDHFKNSIVHFFEVYKKLEKKEVQVNGWLPKADAHRLIKEGQERFSKEG